MRTFQVQARTSFRVEVDETKFTPEFFKEFSGIMWHMDRVEDAVEHLADLFARGLIRGERNEFVEGYGDIEALGVRFIMERDIPRPVSVDLAYEIDLDEIKAKEPA